MTILDLQTRVRTGIANVRAAGHTDPVTGEEDFADELGTAIFGHAGASAPLLIGDGTASDFDIFEVDNGAAPAPKAIWDQSEDSVSINKGFRITTGSLGIGISSPDGTLHVHTGSAGSVTAGTNYDELVLENSASSTGMSFLSPITGNGIIVFGDPDDNDIGRIVYSHTTDAMIFDVNASERMRINSAGALSIQSLTASQDVQTDAGKRLISVSDERLKNILESPTYGLAEILKIKPIRFRFKHDDQETQPVIGFSAQNIKEIIPESVTANDDGFMGINSRAILAACVIAFQEIKEGILAEHTKAIQKLTERILALESK